MNASLLLRLARQGGGTCDLLRADLDAKPFTWVGASALLILSALAATSFVVWKRRLGKNWKRLHRLIYVAVSLVILHFAWARKGSLTSLSGDILLPLAFGAAAVILLVLRVPAVRRSISARRRAAG